MSQVCPKIVCESGPRFTKFPDNSRFVGTLLMWKSSQLWTAVTYRVAQLQSRWQCCRRWRTRRLALAT